MQEQLPRFADKQDWDYEIVTVALQRNANSQVRQFLRPPNYH